MRPLFFLWASSALVAATVVLESNDASSSRSVHDAVPLDSRSLSSTVFLNAFLAQLAVLFPFDVLVQNAADLTLLAQNFIAAVWDISPTRDAIVCADVTIVFARGTNEAGNVGVLVGPEFFDAVAARLAPGKTMAVQGVNYPASILGFLQGGDPLGSQQMVLDVRRLLGGCPSTKLVLSGYSQGGQVVHNTARLLSASLLASLSSTVIFGDPHYPDPLAGIPVSRQLVFCHDTDDICDGGDLIRSSHLDYAMDAEEAADFVMRRL